MITKSIRMPEELLEAISIVAKEENVEKTTAIRKLIRTGFETYLAELYGAGRLSLAQLSRLLGLSQIEAVELLQRRGIKGNLDVEDVVRSLSTFTK